MLPSLQKSNHVLIFSRMILVCTNQMGNFNSFTAEHYNHIRTWFNIYQHHLFCTVYFDSLKEVQYVSVNSAYHNSYDRNNDRNVNMVGLCALLLLRIGRGVRNNSIHCGFYGRFLNFHNPVFLRSKLWCTWPSLTLYNVGSGDVNSSACRVI